MIDTGDENGNEINLTEDFDAETTNSPAKKQKLSSSKWDSPEALKLFILTYKVFNPTFQQNYLK